MSKLIDPDPKLQNNLMAFGYDCGKGWYPLIDELMSKLQVLNEEKYPDLQVVQVKEKWGLLTVYLTYYYPEAEKLIDEYRDKSAKICEICGNPSTVRLVSGWYSSICDDCYEAIMLGKKAVQDEKE